MSSRSQSSHRSRCYREVPNEHVEVAVPELATMSITVTLAPRVRAGLYALLRARLSSTPAQTAGDGGGGVVNLITGDVTGASIQAGTIQGPINIGNNPRRRR